MGVERSASQSSTTSPLEATTPWRSAAPLPRLRASSSTKTPRCANCRATSVVASALPSSTTMTSNDFCRRSR